MTVAHRLIVVGGGGFGRELIGHILDVHRAGGGPAAAGYLDDGGSDVLGRLGYDLPWIGSIADYVPVRGDQFALGIGSPEGKRQVVETLQSRGALFAQVIHPTALVTTRTVIEPGVVLGPFTGTGSETRIGRFVTVNAYSGFGHDSEAGEFTTLSAHVDVMGFARIGSGVFIGSHASIMPRVKVGDGAKVGAGAVVYRNVPAGATVYAPPAKLLKRR